MHLDLGLGIQASYRSKSWAAIEAIKYFNTARLKLTVLFFGWWRSGYPNFKSVQRNPRHRLISFKASGLASCTKHCMASFVLAHVKSKQFRVPLHAEIGATHCWPFAAETNVTQNYKYNYYLKSICFGVHNHLLYELYIYIYIQVCTHTLQYIYIIISNNDNK